MYCCPNCLNQDRKYFAIKNGEIYCRKCISFSGENVKKENLKSKEVILKLDYELSDLQREISYKVLDGFKNKKNVLIKAVCGAGKTELVYDTIKYALQKHLKVGFAIPRKDVVIDLFPRLKQAFPNQKVISIYGGNHKELNGDIIVLTTHQLFRFYNYFDLLIMDEIDAFPYKGSDLLENFFKKALRGNFILMSATASDDLILKMKQESGEVFFLDKRYHNHLLPVPINKTFLFGKLFYLFFLLKKYKKNHLPVLVFTPTINQCERLFKQCFLVPNGSYVHSRVEDRNQIIDDFKKGRYSFLITTSILERGVTIRNLQVVVFNAHHSIYDADTLIQIAGRVGRKIDAFTGEVVFIADYITEEMQNAIKEINRANTS